ncbi:MAG: nucleotidyl transferase AbiEii/AbiGii toxin family protein [Kiritimatiellae bacterium]|nr:nucleotidyl transferase AbiEii/AbiGii toxin family protein [Kiritimatiellia bacterium]
MSRVESMSLRARINRLARREGISPQLALQGFFIERFLARIEKSEYAGNLVIKGGTLMCSILGLRERTTMDIDTTLVGLRGDEGTVERIVEAVAAVDAGDGVVFRRSPARAESIAKDDEYGGWSIGLTAEFGTIHLPIGIDVTYGDAMTPGAVSREFAGVLDGNLRIRLLAYAPETLMAEKVQSILKRGVATTRPRDFYDLHMLCRRGEYDAALFAKALAATMANRHSEEYLARWRETLDAVAESDFQKRQWERYQKKMPYARGIAFADLVRSVVQLMEEAAARRDAGKREA